MAERYKDVSEWTPADHLAHQRGERIESDEYKAALAKVNAKFENDPDDDEGSPASHLRRIQAR
jgi:hypothetical protein